MSISRRTFLGQATKAAPVIAAVGAGVTKLMPGLVQGEQAIALHPSIVGEIGGEPVYESGLLYMQSTAVQTFQFIARIPGQLPSEGMVINRASILIKYYWGLVVRVFSDVSTIDVQQP